MNKINIKPFLKNKNRNLYHLSDSNDSYFYLKLNKVNLPFNLQLYNNNLYLNIELLTTDDTYDDNIKLLNSFEEHICKNVGVSKKFCSNIKDREKGVHIKCMLKRDSKDIILNSDIDLKKMTEYHRLGYKYDIIIKINILWETEFEYGLIYYIYSIERN